MRGESIAKRYASALYDLCDSDIEKAATYADQLDSLCQIFDDVSVSKVLTSPVVAIELKQEVLSVLAKQLGSDLVVEHFLKEVARAQRVAILPAIAKSFRKQIYNATGTLEAEVVTAVDLSEQDLVSITEKLTSLFAKKIILQKRLDKSILGGFVIRVDNSVIDMSLKSKLDQLTQVAGR